MTLQVLPPASPGVGRQPDPVREPDGGHQAGRDPVTGFLDRERMTEQLEVLRGRLLASGDQIALTRVRLDGLAQLASRHGSAAGAAIVAEAAGRLADLTRSNDLIGRISEHEFVVAQPLASAQLREVVDRMARALRLPYTLPSGERVACPMSIGALGSDSLPDAPIGALMDAADQARARNSRIREIAESIRVHEDGLPWRAAITALRDGVVVQDADGRVLHANPAAEWILGLPQGEPEVTTDFEHEWRAIRTDGTPLPPDETPARQALRSGQPVTDVLLGICRPGHRTRWLVVSACPIPQDDGLGPEAVVTTFSDVTEEREARRVLADQSSRLRQAIDAFPHPFFILDAVRDAAGRVVELRHAHINLAAAQLYGCRADDVVGRGQLELFPSLAELGVFDRYVEVIENRRPDVVDIPWFDENGVTGAFEIVVSPFGDGVVITATEVSERRTLVSQLAASEARFLHAFGDGALPMALIQVPAATQTPVLLEVNASMCRFLGRPEAELVGQSIDAHDGLGRVLADFEGIAEAASDGQSVDFQFVHSSGEHRWGEVRVTELGDAVAGSRMWLLQCADTTEWHRIEDELLFHARHDPLTGLPNRGMLIDALASDLAATRDTRRCLGVLLVNLDDFKSVNTDLGLEAGDEYLRRCAALLREVAGPEDHVARLGGDEFALVLRDARDSRRLGQAAEAILARLGRGVVLNATRISAASSIGAALSTRRSTAETLLSSAGVAMRDAKARGGNQWVLASAPKTSGRNILGLEADLRDAVSNGGLQLRYQPIFDLRTGRLDSVEALTRWIHPTRGMIPPDEFIGIAERRNIIGALGDWALETACAQWADWQQRFGAHAPQMAVNVSTRQLGSRVLPDRIAALLAAHRMPANELWLEVTESQVLTAGGPATSELAAIRELGVRVAVDDFGTGYAGFGYLRSLPTDGLKIDKSFVDGVDVDQTAAAIATSMVALGRGLGLVVVAEGIETASQMTVMRALGADLGQGWLWRPALEPAEIDGLIGQRESEVRGT